MEYKNYLNLTQNDLYGNKRRKEILLNIFDKNTLLPKPVIYEDIDDSFKKWVENELDIACEGKKLPTMTLFSNQRFSEYLQTWKFTDSDQNVVMNFKTIFRENNPQNGDNQGGLWNIPGERFYLMNREKIVDNNGTISYLDYKVKQPFCVDLIYKLSIFTNKAQTINEFNTIVNNAFKSRQCYVSPNGHYMPMTLGDISDESEYNIDDRQFFSQSYQIKVMAYIIREDDFKVEEVPARFFISFTDKSDMKSSAEIEEGDIKEIEDENNGNYYYKPITLSLTYPLCSNICKFVIDTNVNIESIQYINIYKNIKILINDEEYAGDKLKLKKGDEVKIKIKRYYIEKESKLILNGYDPDVVYSNDNDLPEIEKDFNQYEDNYEINASD